MGQRSNTFGEGDAEIGASERMCLQSKKREPRFYIIKSNRTLTILTRVVFVVLTLFSAGVITTSVWLMLECRDSFATVRPMLPRNIQFCTNMGMPALFACCTVLFAIFGLGCTGRRLTGYALIIISSVEILQSVTALTFYKCNTMSRQEVMASVNSSLLPCFSPSKFVIPFVSYDYPTILSEAPSFTNINRPTRTTSKNFSSVAWPSAAVDGYGVAHLTHDIAPEHSLPIIQPSLHISRNYIQQLRKRQVVRQDIKVPLDTLNTHHTNDVTFHLTKRRDIQHILTQNSEQVFQQKVQCTPESRYFWNLSQRLKKNEVNKCIQICKAYQIICPVPVENMKYPDLREPLLASPSFTGTRLGYVGDWTRDPGSAYRIPNTGLPKDKSVKGFKDKTDECGYRVYQYVSDLCYYDNKIILPISLCAPFLCIAMSVCFIYLAYCDRKLKEDSQPNIFIQMPESSQNKSCIQSLQDCCRGLQKYLKTSLCRCRIKEDPVWGSLVCCRYCTSIPGHLDSECSNSSHELLHLRTMPSNATAGGALSPAVSQYTLNTSYSDDCSPILPRRS